MRKFLHHTIIALTISTVIFVGGADAALSSVAMADTSGVVKVSEAQSSALQISASEKRAQRSLFSSFRNFLPFRANNTDSDKLLSSVKVFPNPIVDQISLSYRLGKQSSVSIKVMDALGNEVMTLLNQELDAGPQSHVFETSNKLTNGFYFIRVSAGTETVVKRISVL
ncbi:hypothetical protein GCM10007415_14430 [Parapedobacter pyrenivorans]|uniref:Secretion system C-terminal sorting domain-containing protein n=1 Tax=Parapedobacter pyrenivorans TaxID=1305674 RepID=A0A917HLL2_9SPHI|nr:T9SS type A sorting domain-containing protein [Parapedobacter pyrenivorans]GGG82641.1 hypothetical protein GCM10007415_14430 [Parapedobacter pyrenivorans]